MKKEVFEHSIRYLNGRIDMYKPRKQWGEMQPAGINWAALGTVSPTEAKEFALALLDAVAEAEKFNESK